MIANVKEINNNNNDNNNKGQGGQVPSPLPSPLSNQNRFNSFSFKHQGYCFLRVSEILWTKISRFSSSMLQFLDNFRRLLLFFSLNRENRSLHVGSYEKLRCLPLDLLLEVSHCGPSERKSQ